MGNTISGIDSPQLASVLKYFDGSNSFNGFHMILDKDGDVLDYTQSQVLFDPNNTQELKSIKQIFSYDQPGFGMTSEKAFRVLIDDYMNKHITGNAGDEDAAESVPPKDRFGYKGLIGILSYGNPKHSPEFIWSFIKIDKSDVNPIFFRVSAPVAIYTSDGRGPFFALQADPVKAQMQQVEAIGHEIKKIVKVFKELSKSQDKKEKIENSEKYRRMNEEKRKNIRLTGEINTLREQIKAIRNTDLDQAEVYIDLVRSFQRLRDSLASNVNDLTKIPYHNLLVLTQRVTQFIDANKERISELERLFVEKIKEYKVRIKRLEFEKEKLEETSSRSEFSFQLKRIRAQILDEKRELNQIQALLKEVQEEVNRLQRRKEELDVKADRVLEEMGPDGELEILKKEHEKMRRLVEISRDIPSAKKELEEKTKALNAQIRKHRILQQRIYQRHQKTPGGSRKKRRRATYTQSSHREPTGKLVSEQEFDSIRGDIIQSAAHSRFLITSNGIIFAASTAAEELFDEELFGLPFFTLISERQPYSEYTNRSAFEAMVNGTYKDQYILLKNKFDEKFWARIKVSAPFMVRGRGLFLIVTIQRKSPPKRYLELKKAIRTYTIKNVSLKENIKRMEDLERERAEKESKNKVFQRLHNEMLKYEKANQELRYAIDSLKAKISEYQNQKEALELRASEEIKELQKQKKDLMFKKVKLEKTSSKEFIKNSIRRVVGKIDSLKGDMINTANEIKSVEAEIKKLEELRVEAQTRYNRLKYLDEEYREMKNREKRIKAEVREMQERLMQMEHTNLESKLEETKIELMKVLERNNYLKLQISIHKRRRRYGRTLLYSNSLRRSNSELFRSTDTIESRSDDRSVDEEAAANLVKKLSELSGSKKDFNLENLKLFHNSLILHTLRSYFMEYLSNQFNFEKLLFYLDFMSYVEVIEPLKVSDVANTHELSEWRDAIVRWYLRSTATFPLGILDTAERKGLKAKIRTEYDSTALLRSEEIKAIQKSIWEDLVKFVKSAYFKYLREHTEKKDRSTDPSVREVVIVSNMVHRLGDKFGEASSHVESLNASLLIEKNSRLPSKISTEMMEFIVWMLYSNYQVSNMQVNTTQLYNSLVYKKFIVASMELQNVDLKILKNMNQNTQTAFWVNVHNSLLFHAIVEKVTTSRGMHPNQVEKGSDGMSYYIGGEIFTIQRIRQILGINSGGDTYALKEYNPDILFSVLFLECEKILKNVLYPKTLEQDLEDNRNWFLRNTVEIDTEKKTIKFPSLITKFKNHIANNEQQLLEWTESCLNKAGGSFDLGGYKVRFKKLHNRINLEFSF